MDAETSKYLGGDVEHTHLVKGLDYALLVKIRDEEREKQRVQTEVGPVMTGWLASLCPEGAVLLHARFACLSSLMPSCSCHGRATKSWTVGEGSAGAGSGERCAPGR